MTIRQIVVKQDGLNIIKAIKAQGIDLSQFDHVESAVDIDVVAQNVVWMLPRDMLTKQSPRTLGWSAHDDGRLLGVILFNEHNETLVSKELNWFEMFWLSFYPNQYPEVGRKLLDVAIEAARKNKIKKLFFANRANFERSKTLDRLYKRLGMKPDHTVYSMKP